MANLKLAEEESGSFRMKTNNKEVSEVNRYQIYSSRGNHK